MVLEIHARMKSLQGIRSRLDFVYAGGWQRNVLATFCSDVHNYRPVGGTRYLLHGPVYRLPGTIPVKDSCSGRKHVHRPKY